MAWSNTGYQEKFGMKKSEPGTRKHGYSEFSVAAGGGAGRSGGHGGAGTRRGSDGS